MSSIGNLPQTLIDDPQRRIHILLVHHQRRREAQRAPPRPEQQQAFAKRALRQVVRDLWRRLARGAVLHELHPDRKSTRLNSSHTVISYAVFCLKKKKKSKTIHKKKKKKNIQILAINLRSICSDIVNTTRLDVIVVTMSNT